MIMDAELPADHFDGVFVSNFLEHLYDQEAIAAFLEKMRDAMEKGGRIAITGPNYRYCSKEYWDCADHYVALTHVAIDELLYAAGFEIERTIPRYLPYSFRGILPPSPALTKRYLQTPAGLEAARQTVPGHRPQGLSRNEPAADVGLPRAAGAVRRLGAGRARLPARRLRCADAKGFTPARGPSCRPAAGPYHRRLDGDAAVRTGALWRAADREGSPTLGFLWLPGLALMIVTGIGAWVLGGAIDPKTASFAVFGPVLGLMLGCRIATGDQDLLAPGEHWALLIVGCALGFAVGRVLWSAARPGNCTPGRSRGRSRSAAARTAGSPTSFPQLVYTHSSPVQSARHRLLTPPQLL